jgi:homoserine O-acetyltransferase
MVQRAAPFCGSSKTSEHNFVFLEGVKAALTGGDSFKGGFYDAKPEDNLRRTGRVYAGWGFSQAFFWDRVYTDMGHSHRLGVDLAFPTLEDFLVQYWEGHFLDRRDVNDLLSMLWTWQHGDIGQTPGFDGDHVKALQSIRAKLIAMPAVKDLYFPPEDEEYASQYIPNGEVRVIPGVWGHFAGSGDCAVDRQWIDDVIRELLAG